MTGVRTSFVLSISSNTSVIGWNVRSDLEVMSSYLKVKDVEREEWDEYPSPDI